VAIENIVQRCLDKRPDHRFQSAGRALAAYSLALRSSCAVIATQAYGYRFDTPDRRIVISGDTTPAQSVIDNCDGCDVLIHEAYSMATFNAVPEQAQAQRKTNHTSTTELAELATKARPKLLVISPVESRRGRRH
jgi:ribonuclease BN (tRNA processing enzyme)